MVQDRRASESPIAHLKPVTITELEVNRRALNGNELQRLLDTTETGPNLYGMSGYERYLLYRFAVETGLRANEIRSLTVGDFDFDNLTVTVKASSSKHRRQDIQALKPDTAELLRKYFDNRTFNTMAFGGTYARLTDRTAEMIREDLEQAEIPYIDEAGRVFDFHSLRHQTGTMLARAGVHPRDAQAFMRHSSIEITMKYYTHLRKGAEVETAEKIPDLSLSKTKRQAKKLGA
jgi:integrase